jgi:hypothetical protein
VVDQILRKISQSPSITLSGALPFDALCLISILSPRTGRAPLDQIGANSTLTTKRPPEIPAALNSYAKLAAAAFGVSAMIVSNTSPDDILGHRLRCCQCGGGSAFATGLNNHVVTIGRDLETLGCPTSTCGDQTADRSL